MLRSYEVATAVQLTVVTPTFNEAPNVVPLAEDLKRALEGIDYEILVVDDNSPDRTWALVEEMSAVDPRIRVLRRMENPGLAASVIDGFLAAKGAVVACIDADLQHDPGILRQMLEELQKSSGVVVGSRYIAGGGTEHWSRVRKLKSWIATKIAQWFLGVKLKDPMSGYFLMWRKDFCAIQGDLQAHGFKILLEILAILRPATVKEVPYTFRTRFAGESKLSGRVVLEYLAQVFRLSAAGRFLRGRFVKFAVIGGSGVAVNLAAMDLLMRMGQLADWRSSLIASLAANVYNYVLNNLWTFSDRAHKGSRIFKGYLSYLAASLVGLGLTTGVFAGLIWGIARYAILPQGLWGSNKLVSLGCQLIGIAVGLLANYRLNERFTWPSNEAAGLAPIAGELKRKAE